MASFHAVLTVGGKEYPIVRCAYDFSQATGERGRATSKTRSGLLSVDLDVPHDNDLLEWAIAPNKKQSGHLIFEETDKQATREKVEFEDAYCVSYEETFVSDAADGAYRCSLQISAAKLKLGAVEKDNSWVESR